MNHLNQLIDFLNSLRQGQCAWTQAQDIKSLAPQTLEEVYEFVEAVESNDMDHIKHECADLLYHVLFYAQIGQELGAFDLNSLAKITLDKHAERLPKAENRSSLDAEAVNKQWEKNKIAALSNQTSVLDNISSALPALTRAVKIQYRAALTGFDWPNTSLVIDKLHEELNELQDAMQQQSHSAIQDELGDVLFTCVNLARHLKINPESALRQANQKFTKRFKQVERLASEQACDMDKMDIDALEALWQQAKAELPSH